MKKAITLALLLILVPIVANAAWWNPLSWTWNPITLIVDVLAVFHPVASQPAPQAVAPLPRMVPYAISSAPPASMAQDIIGAGISPLTASTSEFRSQPALGAVSPVPRDTVPASTTTHLLALVPARSTSTPTSAPVQAPAVPAVIEPRDIAVKANVGLLCHYKSSNPLITAAYGFAKDADGDIIASKGSGVIINPDGYILTVKHLVDFSWTNWAYASSMTDDDKIFNSALKLDYCEVAVPNADTVPSPEEIKTINPSIDAVHPFPYIAKLYFEPAQGKLSDDEYRSLDFAVLKITGPRPDCATFNMCKLPATYPYAPVRYDAMPPVGQAVLNFGYPAELTNSSISTFSDLFLHGAVGRVTGYSTSTDNAYLKDETIEWSADDVMSGRSGSPVYWKGYVAGIEYGVESDNSTKDYALGMSAIHQIMKDSGLEKILSTY